MLINNDKYKFVDNSNDINQESVILKKIGLIIGFQESKYFVYTVGATRAICLFYHQCLEGVVLR